MNHPTRSCWLTIVAILCWVASAKGQSAPASVDFAARFETIRDTATPAQLYAFLYDLPKGGDLHHHLGGDGWPADWYAIATDPARNGGETFYTRTSLVHYDTAEGAPAVQFRTVRKSAYDAFPDAKRTDYKALADLTADERAAWQSALMLDRPGKGRDEFFEWIWPRLGDLLTDPHVMAELTVVNMVRFGAQGARYLEPQALPFYYRDHAGKPMDAEAAERIFEDRLTRPDALATGVTVRFLHSRA